MAKSGPHIIVLGNEKGGSGKSTTAMHLIVALLAAGKKVGSVDLDARQGSLTRYVENRRKSAEGMLTPLPMPEHIPINQSKADSRDTATREDEANLAEALQGLSGNDFIVIDTPGSDSALSRAAHIRADTLISPLNDSFLDLDLFGRIEDEGATIRRPSVYAETVWEQRKRRAMAGGRPIDWVVMRNRLSSLDARNKRDIGKLLEQLSKRIGFRLAPGFTERVIFRELFPRGLTLLDLSRKDAGVQWRMSHVAARQEVRELLEALNLLPPVPVDESAASETVAG
ncbi:division plane positioning ATPase MipZ [Dongia sp.]|jgi:chromosome partitioning protein|uniref:division plane positioning ATPase MipZ n=1 Tax=Dongia sp. TaxID=1977262 RepID=UPI0034A532F1